jgi:hypothetical protein
MLAAAARKVINEASRVFASAIALARLPPIVPSSARPASVVMKVARKAMKTTASVTPNTPTRARGDAVDAARSAGVDLLGLTARHASSEHKTGFLMGFAAHAPGELEVAVKKLVSVFYALNRRTL